MSRPKESQPTLEQHAPSGNALDKSDQAVGRRIREAREARGFTQQAVSTRSKWVDSEEKGISRTTLLAYEAGTSRPGTREIRILSETLFVTPNYLIFGKEQPFEASHTAMEALGAGRSDDLSQVAQLALVLTALKGHERDALLSLALSLAGRQLGDARLGGLRMLAGLSLTKAMGDQFADLSPESFEGGRLIVSLEELGERLSAQMTANLGNKLRSEDGEEFEGEWLYPDPKKPSAGA
jgi:transcriptional regulator with XRE-family HTH domain